VNPDRFDAFVSRWSRRKLGAAKAANVPATAAASAPFAEQPLVAGAQQPSAAQLAASAAPAEPAESSPAESTLPSIDSLQGLGSDYEGFLKPGVDEHLRRTALKKLFGDPHFNVQDGLDIYIDDYTREDPIPEAMLKTLVQARGLLFPIEEKRASPADAPENVVVPAADATPQAEHTIYEQIYEQHNINGQRDQPAYEQHNINEQRDQPAAPAAPLASEQGERSTGGPA